MADRASNHRPLHHFNPISNASSTLPMRFDDTMDREQGMGGGGSANSSSDFVSLQFLTAANDASSYFCRFASSTSMSTLAQIHDEQALELTSS